MIGALALGLLLGIGVGHAQEPVAEELQREARERYDADELDEARRLAEAAITADGTIRTATARRIQLDVMLRTGDLDYVEAILVPYNALADLAPPERAWSQRLERRLAFERADARADLGTMIANLGTLQAAAAELWSSEKAWLAWAELRVEAREAERAGDLDRARAALEREGGLNGAPERAWKEAARARLAVGEALQRCDWTDARDRLGILADHPAHRDRVSYERARIELRERAATGEVDKVKALLDGLRRFAESNPEWAAWAEGYALWMERAQALRDGDTTRAAELAEAVADWRERFPSERDCGLVLGGAAPEEVKEAKEGLAKKEKQEEPKVERKDEEKERPRGEGDASLARELLGVPETRGWLWTGVQGGVLGWQDELVALQAGAQIENGVLSDDLDEETVAAFGLGLEGGWTLPVGLGLRAELSAAMTPERYPIGEGLAGLTLQRRRLSASVLGGARSFTTVSPDDVLFWCELKQKRDDLPDCEPDDLRNTQQTPAAGLFKADRREVSLAWVVTWELGLSLLPKGRLQIELGSGRGEELWLAGGGARIALGREGRGLTLGVAGEWMEVDVDYDLPNLDLEGREAWGVFSVGWMSAPSG